MGKVGKNPVLQGKLALGKPLYQKTCLVSTLTCHHRDLKHCFDSGGCSFLPSSVCLINIVESFFLCLQETLNISENHLVFFALLSPWTCSYLESEILFLCSQHKAALLLALLLLVSGLQGSAVLDCEPYFWCWLCASTPNGGAMEQSS